MRLYQQDKNLELAIKYIEQLESLDGYLLSIDFFDTLVFRLSDTPKKVFIEIGRRLILKNIIKETTPEEFQTLRAQAETAARKENYNKKNRLEVTIEEIYEKLKCIISNTTEAIAIEKKAEQEFCLTNPFILDLALFAKHKGAKICITSDFYLGKKELIDILQTNSIEKDLFDEIFVSSEFGVGKHDFKLFEIVSSQMNTPFDRIIHIGDNEISDVINPKSFGIKSFLYKSSRFSDDIIFREGRVDARSHTRAYGLAAIRSVAGSLDGNLDPSLRNHYQIGANFIGPILTMFSEWLNKKALAEGNQKLLFLTREGEFLKEIFDICHEGTGIPSEIIATSRYATSLADIANMDTVFNLLRAKTCRTVKDFFEIIRLHESIYSATGSLPQKEVSTLTKEETESLGNFLMSAQVQKHLKDLQDENNQGFLKYFTKTAGNQINKIGLVDLGWGGTIQENIENILTKSGSDFSISGFYLGVSGAAKQRVLKGRIMHSFLPKFGSSPHLNVLYRSPEPIEQSCMSHHGSVIGYKYTKQDGAFPIFDTYRLSDEETAKRKAIQSGARNFANVWKYVKENKIISEEIQNELSLQAMDIACRLLKFPRKDEAILLGELHHDDNLGTDNLKKICNDYDKNLIINNDIRSAFLIGYWPYGTISQVKEKYADIAIYVYGY